MKIRSLIAAIVALLFPRVTVASITADFSNVQTKLEALKVRLCDEMEAHDAAITKHELAITAKTIEAAAAHAVITNLNKLLDIKE